MFNVYYYDLSTIFDMYADAEFSSLKNIDNLSYENSRSLR